VGAIAIILSIFCLVSSCILADAPQIEYLYFASIFFTAFVGLQCASLFAKSMEFKVVCAVGSGFIAFCLLVEFRGNSIAWSAWDGFNSFLLIGICTMCTFIIEKFKEKRWKQ
jgi:hypothetical protein